MAQTRCPSGQGRQGRDRLARGDRPQGEQAAAGAENPHGFGTTAQGDSGTRFRADYIKPSGAIGFYHPDWVAVQEADGREVNWIIETKGRIWESTRAKDEAMASWCNRVSEQTGARWRYIRINQKDADLHRAVSCAALVDGLLERGRPLLGPQQKESPIGDRHA